MEHRGRHEGDITTVKTGPEDDAKALALVVPDDGYRYSVVLEFPSA